MVDNERLLGELVRGGVKFIAIGGVAGIIHGSARLTYDLDIIYARDPDNLGRIADVLRPFRPYLRGAVPGLPFSLDRAALERGLNLTLTTTLGDLDLIGEATGGGTYASLLPRSQEVAAFGTRFLCVGLESLIQLKRAAGRPSSSDLPGLPPGTWLSNAPPSPW